MNKKVFTVADLAQASLGIHAGIKSAINSLIQEIKQDPSISISQRNYAIKKMEELAERL